MTIDQQQQEKHRLQPPAGTTVQDLSSFSSDDDSVHPINNGHHGTSTTNFFPWLFCDPFASTTKKPIIPNKYNPNLTKKEIAMIEEIHSQLERIESLDEQLAKLGNRLQRIDDRANTRALQQRWTTSVTSLW